jgi:putative permease
MKLIRGWYERFFSDPQAVILALLLVIGFVVVLTMGQMLTPVFASLVLAYLLDGVVLALQERGVPRIAAVVAVFLLFIVFLAFALLGLLPRLSYQVTQLFNQLPSIIGKGQEAIMRLPSRYPDLISQGQVQDIIDAIRAELAGLGQRVVSVSVASVVGIMTLLVYLPRDRALSARVWQEVNGQIANYVRGKIWEILIVGTVTYVTFLFMNLQYAVLLATLVGLSVVIPYIGAAVVTLPIAAIAFFQWGWTPDFWWIMVAYGVIQALDGNVLVPLLFSEVVNLHTVAIIIAVLVFGGLWGFWGVFFAIPLATLVKAVLSAWPRPVQPLPAPPVAEES